MKQLLLICSLTFSIISFAQTNCEFQFKSDSCALSIPKNKEVVEVMEVKIKKNYLVQFIKQDKKNYLKIIVQDNLGFGKKGSLLLLSNKKQIYIKSIELQVINKTSAYFLISLNETYYLENIKEMLMNYKPKSIPSIKPVKTKETKVFEDCTDLDLYLRANGYSDYKIPKIYNLSLLK